MKHFGPCIAVFRRVLPTLTYSSTRSVLSRKAGNPFKSGVFGTSENASQRCLSGRVLRSMSSGSYEPGRLLSGAVQLLLPNEFTDCKTSRPACIALFAPRQNLAPFQRCELALELEPLIAARAKENQGTRTDLSQISAESVDTREELVKAAGVSHDTIHRMKVIKVGTGPTQQERLRSPGRRRT